MASVGADVKETWADKGMTTMVTALALIVVALLVLILFRSLAAYVEVQRAVSISAACDGGGFESETPRWRLMFTGDTIDVKKDDDCEYVAKTPHYMYNKAYEIFFTWYGKFDRTIIGLGYVLIVACVLLMTIRTCAFDNSEKFMLYMKTQCDHLEPFSLWARSGLYTAAAPGGPVDIGVSNWAHGWLPRVWTNRLFTPFQPWFKGVGELSTYAGVLLTALWLLPNAALFVLRLGIFLWWWAAHFLKGVSIDGSPVFQSHYMYLNLTILLVLIVFYAIFTRAFLGVNRLEPSNMSFALSVPVANPACHQDPFSAAPFGEDIRPLKPASDAYKEYQAALWAMGAEWRRVALAQWTAYNNAAIMGGLTPRKVVGFREYLKAKATPDASTGALDGAGITYEWLRRAQLNLQLSDADFEQEMSEKLRAFFQLTVDDADDGNAADGGRCKANGMVMGYMVYDADFMSALKGNQATLFAAMARVRGLATERDFSAFFTTEAAYAAVFLAAIAYLVLLRWNDTVVYYLLLATLASAGAAAFAFVVLQMLRPVGI